MKGKIEKVQKLLAENQMDGWLLYDFRKQNDLACSFLEISPEQMLTRRFFYWIPVTGEPQLLTHAVEKFELPGRHQSYTTWQDLSAKLSEWVKPDMTIAMEVSPIPYLSKVDGYTLDLVRAKVKDVVSSGNLLQQFTSVLTPEQIQSHFTAADLVQVVAKDAWSFIAANLDSVTEWDVQAYILEQLKRHHCITDDGPICATNAHSADPHYCADKKSSSVIRKGDFILIDLWARLDVPQSCYADITQVGMAGEPSQEHQRVFDTVKRARDAAIALIQEGKLVRGCDADQAARKVIIKEGYGEFFIHRLGHNIHTKDHGPGANLDSYETEDTRLLLPSTCFSIEPGIYLPGKFGVRLECDMLIQADGQAIPTGGLQQTIINLLQ
jgi:Xaa-Pro aminopeptidase